MIDPTIDGLEKVRDAYKYARELRDSLVTACKYFSQNKENTLDDRWNVYVKVVGYLPLQDNMGLDFIDNVDGDAWLDEFYYERYRDVYYLEIVEEFKNDPSKVAKYGSIEDLKEAIIETWCCGFTIDW